LIARQQTENGRVFPLQSMGAAGTFEFLEGWTAAEIDEVEEFITAFGAGLNKRKT
jgi:hypothetical protein